ncbi:hypothetical protein HGRIS_010365 [Hohenbuehelia grisea]|uniref:Uncharacterized protein n=1 Tax=Hohenbuehelia grisea TaxID=104357 RepID=A0ABR3J4I1_9AGAR
MSFVKIANRSRHTFSYIQRLNARRGIHLRGSDDPYAQARLAGLAARNSSNSHPLDAASPHAQYKPYIKGSGNKEQIGFVDQVGGQSFTADHFEFGRTGSVFDGQAKGGTKEPMSPDFLASAIQGGVKAGEEDKIDPGAARTVGKSQSASRKLTGSFVDPVSSTKVEYEARRTIEQNRTEDVSGMWSNAGVPGSEDSRDYRTVAEDDPYDLPSASRDQKLRYGGRHWKVENEKE